MSQARAVPRLLSPGTRVWALHRSRAPLSPELPVSAIPAHPLRAAARRLRLHLHHPPQAVCAARAILRARGEPASALRPAVRGGLRRHRSRRHLGVREPEGRGPDRDAEGRRLRVRRRRARAPGAPRRSPEPDPAGDRGRGDRGGDSLPRRVGRGGFAAAGAQLEGARSATTRTSRSPTTRQSRGRTGAGRSTTPRLRGTRMKKGASPGSERGASRAAERRATSRASSDVGSSSTRSFAVVAKRSRSTNTASAIAPSANSDVAGDAQPAEHVHQRRLEELRAARVPVAVLDRGPGLQQADREQAADDHREQADVDRPEREPDQPARSTSARARAPRRQKSIRPIPSMP